jgi:hypothetical protein
MTPLSLTSKSGIRALSGELAYSFSSEHRLQLHDRATKREPWLRFCVPVCTCSDNTFIKNNSTSWAFRLGLMIHIFRTTPGSTPPSKGVRLFALSPERILSSSRCQHIEHKYDWEGHTRARK